MTTEATLPVPLILPDLIHANRAWADRITSQDPDFFKRQKDNQAPGILWIGCADSRAPETSLLDRLPGDAFVTRNVANLFNENDPSAAAILHHGIVGLSPSVQIVIVAGHTDCGGVTAARNIAIERSRLDPLLRGPNSNAVASWIEPIVKLAKELINQEGTPPPDSAEFLELLTIENVKRQVQNVETSKIYQEARGRVSVHGCLYDVGKGHLIDISSPVFPIPLKSAEKLKNTLQAGEVGVEGQRVEHQR